MLIYYISGVVFVDGNEMKTRLPPFVKGCTITFHTELLPNGKVRVSVEVKEKEVAFDWTIDSPDTELSASFGAFPNMSSLKSFYFGVRFSHEDWKITVE